MCIFQQACSMSICAVTAAPSGQGHATDTVGQGTQTVQSQQSVDTKHQTQNRQLSSPVTEHEVKWGSDLGQTVQAVQLTVKRVLVAQTPPKRRKHEASTGPKRMQSSLRSDGVRNRDILSPSPLPCQVTDRCPSSHRSLGTTKRSISRALHGTDCLYSTLLLLTGRL